MDSFSYEIVKHFGVISQEKSGWQKELNLVAWSGRAPKLDIRDWAPNHEKMGKGVTLNKEEATKLAELLVSVKLEQE
jgi:hypothetical protein